MGLSITLHPLYKQRENAMGYRIDTKYCWYNQGSMIVKMYFINQIPFTFDELPSVTMEDINLIELADENMRYEPEDLYRTSFYLIDEQAHPCLFPIELENPEELPND
jgi:hypothetical protein